MITGRTSKDECLLPRITGSPSIPNQLSPGKKPGMHPLIAQAVAFTDAYRSHRGAHPAVREAMCLKTQYPAIMGGIREDDLFAGRVDEPPIAYTGTIRWAAYPVVHTGLREEGKQGGYFFDFAAEKKYTRTAEEKAILSDLIAFWESECTSVKIQHLWDDELRECMTGDGQIAGRSVGFASAVDIDRLMHLGIPGLINEIGQKRRAHGGGEANFYDGLRVAVDVMIDVCRHYEAEARQAAVLRAGESRDRSEAIADTLAAIVDHPPYTLREAIQLAWLYTLMAGGRHIEGPRFDIAFGDFYAHDLDSGLLNEEEALDLILALWRLFHENGETAVCRIVVGGIGRRNEANADRFALAAIEATRRFRRVTPQLTLRIYKGQNPALLRKGYAAIGEGCIYPMLYNDDVVVPAVAKLLGVSEDTARAYHPLGCGEYMIAGSSPSMLDVVWSIPKTLDAVLHNGANPDGNRIGPQTGDIESFDTFEKLHEAFRAQARFAAKLSANAYASICRGYSGECAFLLASLLTDDCLGRGKALFDGGVRYKGACVMGHGFTNAADALTAIRQLVYEEKRLTLREVVTALDADFVGYESIRRMLLDVPKFGNDLDEADRTLVEMWSELNELAAEAGASAGLDFHIVSSVNPGGYGLGKACGATADGRRKGGSFAIGHAPTAGFDRNGLTALFNSVVKIDPANGGATTNFKISREFFTAPGSPVESLFGVYFARGGMQASITVVNRDDLEAAMREPEKYSHVLVRLGGWSARFIDLEPSVQREILQRTLY